MTTDHSAPGRVSPVAALARMQTGAKLFLILSAALLPLAIIAFFATLQTTRTANQQIAARLRVAAAESSRAIAIELIGDTTALRAALISLDADPGNAQVCARVQGVFVPQNSSGADFTIVGRDGKLLCGSSLAPDMAAFPSGKSDALRARIVPGRGVVLGFLSPTGRTYAAAFFPTKFLSEIGRPSAFVTPYSLDLVLDDARLSLHDLTGLDAVPSRRVQSSALALDKLRLEMAVPKMPLSSPVLIAMLLPILMWAAAASIAWFVVDRLLIRPLRELRANAAAYVPGTIIDPRELSSMPAQEIRELGDTIRAISRTVALHEADLAAGLVRQTRLTKEVHHRVKNNLQVIASLINFHARSAQHEEATAAYASIQRRVDALAVVHRNHHAENEENRGIGLREMVGELSSNIRATAPTRSALGITLDVPPFLVNQDVAVAIAFLITEIVELAMGENPAAQLRLSVRDDAVPDRAVLRVSSPALIESESLRAAIDERYGRVMAGLARQLRSALHHDPLVGAYEISIAVTGRD